MNIETIQITALITLLILWVMIRLKVDALGDQAMRALAEAEGEPYQRAPRFSLRLSHYLSRIDAYSAAQRRAGVEDELTGPLKLWAALCFVVGAAALGLGLFGLFR